MTETGFSMENLMGSMECVSYSSLLIFKFRLLVTRL